MADASDHESALLLGFKRSPDELPTDSNSFHPDESQSLGSPQKKSKCSSSNAVVHEDSQEIKGDKLGCSENGAVIKLDGLPSALTGTQESKEGELGSRNDVVTEQDIARYEKKGFCGIQEFGEEAKEKEQLDSKNDVVMEEQDFAKDEKRFSGIQEFGEEEQLGTENDVVMELSSSVAQESDILNEKEQYLAKYEVGFPGIEETGEPKTLNDVVAESFCGSLGVNGPEQLSDSVTQVVKFESSKGILGEYVIGDGKIELVDDTVLIESTRVNGWDPLKIEVLDDTSLVQTVSEERGSMGAANYPKWNGDQKNVKQEMDGKNEKRSRKRGGKGRKKRMVEAQNGFQKKGSGSEHVYSMKEMEALRFVNVDEQRKKWIEVYSGLGPAIAGEYDGLFDCNYQKQFEVNFDPRQQFRRKEAAYATCGDEVSDNMDLGFQSMDTLDPAHGLSSSDIYGCTAVQEECSEDDEGDAGYSSILRPAFLVTGEPNFDSGPPQDGLEFIRRVRWEAERIPNVKVAKVERSKLKKEQTIYMPRIPDIPTCPEQLMPLKQWEDAFLADFSELRLALSCHDVSCATISGEPQSVAITHEEECLHKDPNGIIPEKIAEEECLHKDLILERTDDLASLGVDSCQPIDLSAESFSTANGNDLSPALSSPRYSFCVGFDSSPNPALSAILGMDSVARVSMLEKRITSVETTSSLSRDDCAWLFALCAAVDTPLDADTSAALRSLLRKCACLRAEKSELDDEAVMLNILVTISGKYFGQSEGP